MRRFNLRQVTIIEQVSVQVPSRTTQTIEAVNVRDISKSPSLASLIITANTRECQKR